MKDRVVLAYSGGLDTTVAISWIAKERNAEVVCVSIDLGQGGEDLESVRQRALDCGAVESIVVDATPAQVWAVISDLKLNCNVTYRHANNPIIDRRILSTRADYGLTLMTAKGGAGAK
mgnify:CR=1 FL=1